MEQVKTEQEYNSTFWNLVQAIRNGEVVAFVGAGVSQAVRGTPGWTKLLDELDNDARSQVRSEMGAKFFAQYFEDFMNSIKASAKNDPIVAAEQYRKILKDKFQDCLKKALESHRVENELAVNGLNAFLKLPFYRIVTTNYDDLLTEEGRKCQPNYLWRTQSRDHGPDGGREPRKQRIQSFTHKDVDKFAEFLRNGDSADDRSIFHLHGSFDASDSIVFAETDYRGLYSRGELVELVESIFSTKSALFIGFSMTDMDVMQFFRRIVSHFPSTRENHFAVLPKPANKTPSDLQTDTIRLMEKYGIGAIYYDVVDNSHDQLWDLIKSLFNHVKEGPEPTRGHIAIVMDKEFPLSSKLSETVNLLNRVQSQIRYEIHNEVKVEFTDGFARGDKAGPFVPLQRFREDNAPRYDGVFAFTDKRESGNFFFCDRRFEGFVSTWFWNRYVEHPSIYEFLVHSLVLLTVHFYDHHYNHPKIIKPHNSDTGCLFDFTELLRNRIRVIENPSVCDECQKETLPLAFKDKAVDLGMHWLRQVLPLLEENKKMPDAVYQTARFQVKPESLAICQQAIREFIDDVRKNEPETRIYLAMNENSDPTKFLHVFIFESKAAQDRHSNSDAVKRFAATLYPNCVAPVEFTEYSSVAEKLKT